LPEVICNTSPVQYLHQLDLLHILPALAGRVVIPSAVELELAVGRESGVNLPDISALDWVTIRRPASTRAVPLVSDLGPGETEVLMLALESPGALVILDDALARRVADFLKLQMRGTLGLLLDAKRAGLVPSIAPLLDQLRALRFRLSAHTRAAVLIQAGEIG
jgi:predicted nucleic acid-binding protein